MSCLGPRLALVALAACQDPPAPPKRFPIEVRATSDMDDPIAGVAAKVADRPMGYTGRDGVLHASIEGRDGDRVRILLTPPAGHRVLSPTSIDLALHLAAPLGGGRPNPQPVHATLRLAPAERRYALLVRTDGRAGLSVSVAGARRLTTDAWGAALLLHRAKPGTKLAVALEAGPGSPLRPSRAHRTFVLPDRDDVLLFDQVFREAPPGRRARRPRARPRARPAAHSTWP